MTLIDAKALLEWMRAEGISFARVGDVTLSLDGPAPVQDDGIYLPRTRAVFVGPDEDPDLYGGDAPSFEEPKS